MGVFDYGIFGSDDALDARAEIVDAIDAYDRDLTPSEMREGLESHQRYLVNSLKGKIDHWKAVFDGARLSDKSQQALNRERYLLAVQSQVLAATLMEFGCSLTERTRDWLIDAISNDYEDKLGMCPDEDVLPALEAVGAEDELADCLQEKHGERVQGRVRAINALLDALRDYNLDGGVCVTLDGPRSPLERFAHQSC